jgi:hypothetical protein
MLMNPLFKIKAVEESWRKAFNIIADVLSPRELMTAVVVVNR